MAEYHLSAPLTEEAVRQLRIGDTVYLTGKAFTCRSRLHRWVFDEGNPAPEAALSRDVLIHVGPIVLREDDNFQLVSFMPTSSIRFEKWGARSVEDWSLRMIIGKTTMGQDTMDTMARLGCVHCSPQSVSPNLWCDSIQIDGVELFHQLGTIEATWHMNLQELGPFVVDIDCRGGNLYRSHEAAVDARRTAALRQLGIPADFQYTKLY